MRKFEIGDYYIYELAWGKEVGQIVNVKDAKNTNCPIYETNILYTDFVSSYTSFQDRSSFCNDLKKISGEGYKLLYG